MRCLLPLLVLLGWACGSAGPTGESYIVRDSAGIAIVENRVAATSDAGWWRFSEPPLTVLGVRDGDSSHQFSGVVGAALLSDGRIVVGDGLSGQLRFFDGWGMRARTVGGIGGGPGEFARLTAIDRIRGDTVVGSDWPVGTSVWFDARGEYVRTIRAGPYRPGLAGRYLPDGTLLVDVYERGSYGNEIEWWAAHGTSERFRPNGLLLRVGRTGEVLDTVRAIAGEEWFKIGRPGQGLVTRRSPFGPTTRVAWSADRIFIGETMHREVEVRLLDGTLERLIRWEDEPVRVTARDREAFRELVLSGPRVSGRRADLERWLSVVSYPDVKRAFRTLATDRSGLLWVRASAHAERPRDRWTVFEPTGRLVAQVIVPAGLTLLDIGYDYAIAIWRDQLNVEFVRLYMLSK